ncbi:MAG: hypothetical protein A3F67_05380 [Verrucomicrobia bacterium RIFCSPHIGHO2_12_FULL_41_10]|nr:MAG: hypothetical protein A3F67_05380 [Verrucomicrobia bacterium RIFCSPHIGHO2_12_FULL_41_10]
MMESIIALLVFFGLQNRIPLSTQIIISWDSFALAGIILTWMAIFTKDPYEIKRRLRVSDTTQKFLFFIIILAAVASFLATWLLLASAKESNGIHLAAAIALAMVTVIFSWVLVHTRFALHYANMYYNDAKSLERDKVSGGLIFPGKESPDYFDFVYFSFIIGMTCQVSDVQISNKHFRRLALIHGLISFGFNTAILALVVNIVAGLL